MNPVEKQTYTCLLLDFTNKIKAEVDAFKETPIVEMLKHLLKRKLDRKTIRF